MEAFVDKTWYYKALLLQRTVHISTFLYLLGNEFLTEPSDVPLSLKNLSTLNGLITVRVFTESSIYKLPYFKLSFVKDQC